jgi:acyl-coenzyme A synthetase/AMP-(fatty) acid ligase
MAWSIRCTWARPVSPSPGHRIVVLDEQYELPAGQPGILAIDREQSPMCWFAGYAACRPRRSSATTT